MRQHRDLCQLFRHCAECRSQVVHERQDYLVAGAAEHERMGQIVYIFGCASKMKKFTDFGNLRVVAGFLLEKILYRLDVMIGGTFDLFYTLGVRLAEAVNDLVERFIGAF